MYLPILRGKQFELLALREFAQEINGSNKICPIIEPVKIEIKGLETACKQLIKYNVNFTIIINPLVGEIKTPDYILNFLLSNSTFNEYANFRIGVHALNTDQLKGILDLLESRNNTREVVIIHNDMIEESFFSSMNFNYQISYNLINEDKIKSRRYKRLFPDQTRITAQDSFISKTKNSAYTSQVDEFFSEEHLVYSDEGYVGFSDFLTIGEQYSDGGFLPWAVAIHLTYISTDSTIRIHHFVSDSNDDYADTPGKFAEALQKLIDFIPSLTYKTKAVAEFEKIYASAHYPGLGSIKKLSILNHLELINHLLP